LTPVNRLTSHSFQTYSKDTQKEGIMHPIAFSIITGVVLLGVIVSFYLKSRGHKKDSDFNIYS
jgi:hypothetical protein